ITT
ncbi:response regulator, partial [Vibrio parahaemolyticus V-223/04]